MSLSLSAFKRILLLADKAFSISMFTLRASFTAETELEQGNMHRAGMDTWALLQQISTGSAAQGQTTVTGSPGRWRQTRDWRWCLSKSYSIKSSRTWLTASRMKQTRRNRWTDGHTHTPLQVRTIIFTLKPTLTNLSIRQSKSVQSRGCTLHIPQLIFLWNTTVWPKIWQQRNAASVCS